MQTYNIEIQELLARVVSVKAENLQEAYLKVREEYKNAEIVLDSSDFIDVKFTDINSPNLQEEIIEMLNTDKFNHFSGLNNPENPIFKKADRLRSLLY